MPVRLRRALSRDEETRLHFESVEMQRAPDGWETYVVCDDSGYFAHATGHGPCPESARQQALDLARLVAVPGIFYREDIALDAGRTIREVESLLGVHHYSTRS